MSNAPVLRALSIAALAAAASLARPTPAAAQGGALSGRVVHSVQQEGVSGASLRLYTMDGRLVASGVTDPTGAFSIRRVSPGLYELLVQSFGFRAVHLDSVRVGQTEIAVGDIALQPYAAQLDAVVVTASRSEENLLQSPAPIQVVDARTVSERPATTIADFLKGLTGVDLITIGLTQHAIVARGFNDVSSGSLFELVDNRWASIPSLRINTYSLVTVANDDIDHIELVLGPGSALYGPNVDRGVMHIVTRSPLEDHGTVLTVTGGVRDNQAGQSQGFRDRGLVQMSGRHVAHLSARTALKISGLYMSGNDWRYTDPQEVIARQTAIRDGASPDTLRIGERDFETSRWAFDGRLDTYIGDRARLSISAGRSHLDKSIELTPVGAAQGQNWSYNYAQVRLSSGHLFAQTYINQSDAGGSYLLRDGSTIVDKSYIWVGQLQHGSDLGAHQKFLYGADVIRTVPRTEGTISGIHENADDLTEVGGYLQSETALTSAVSFIAAGRLDWHSRVHGLVFSPRAAVVVRPSPFQAIRLTYNRAFSQPSTQQLFLDLPSSSSLGPFTAFGVRATGVPTTTGFTFRRDCAGGLCMYSPFDADPTQALPVNAAPFWQDAVSEFEAASEQVTGQPLDPALEATLRGLDPTGSVGTVLRKADVGTQQYGDVLDPAAAVTDIAPLQPAITNSLELGFKGFLPPRIYLSADIYATRVDNFVGPLAIETPNAFFDPQTLSTFLAGPLAGLGIDSLNASRIIQGLSAVPLGTVSPQEVPGAPTDLYVTFRNFGKVHLWGADLTAALPLGERIEIGAGYSYVSKNYFPNVDGIDDIALNAPRHKGSASIRYRTSGGFSAELRGRRVGRFDVKAGVYKGIVEPYTIVDLNLDYPLPFLQESKFTATALNLLDNRHREIVGAPTIGRMVYFRVTHTF